MPTLVLILIVIQLFFPFKVWVLLVSGFGGMWLLSYLWARSLKRGLQIEREIRFGWKQIGDRLRERVILENHGWAPGFWVEIDDHSDMREYNISSVTEIRGRRSQNWHTQGVCNNRGLYTLGPVTLETGDPFGLYKVTVEYTDAVNMMVVPPVISLPEIEIASGGQAGEGRSLVKSLMQTVTSTGVREYAPGDSLRWLHWPTTARTGEPYIRVFDDEPASDWRILLDLDARVQVGEGQNSTEEHSVILAASLVNQGLQSGKPVGLLAQGDELVWHHPNIGDSHLWSVLRSLATVRPGRLPLTHLLERVRTSLGPRTSLIIITANLSLEWLDALELLRRNGVVPTILLLDPISFGGKGDVEIIRKQLRKLGIRHYVIKSDLLDRPEPEQPEELGWLLTQNRKPNFVVNKWQVLWRKLVQNLRSWGLLFVFFFGLANALNFAVRGLEINLIWNMLLLGAFVGWLFARSDLSGRAAAILSSMAGVEVAILRIGRFGEPVRQAFNEMGRLFSQAIAWQFESAAQPNIYPLLWRLVQIGERLEALGFRLLGWFFDLLAGQPVYDPVVIAFLWGLAVWGTAVWAMWCIIRYKNTLLALLPGIALVAISLALIQQSSFYFTLMFGVASALLVITNFDFRERIWQLKEVRYTTGIQSNIAVAAFSLALGLMTIAALTPSVSIERIADFFQRLTGEDQEQELVSSLGLENRQDPDNIYILDVRRFGGLPNAHLIGSGPELSEQVVMVARMETSLESFMEPGDTEQPPLYLRSLTYDSYNGRGWVSRDTQVEDYRPGDQMVAPDLEHIFPVRQQIQFVEEGSGILYTLGEPTSVDQAFQAAWRLYDENNGQYDLFGVTVSEEVYRADSYVSVYSEDELRAAGQDYPDWIQDRYISLPAEVPERIYALARDLTATEPNPYDRALALESYLRTIPYTLDVDTGPADQDIVEYFLFDLQKGYCDYYASAMVVMARAAGFPARYVIGYIGENFDKVNQVYIVTADQAHAWAEVYFPGYGWIPFEPTGGRAALERAQDQPATLPDDFELDLTPLVPENRPSLESWSKIIGQVLVGALLLVVLGWLVAEVWLYLTPTRRLPEKIFRRLYRSSLRVGIPLQPGDTAFVFARKLNQYLILLSRESRWENWILSHTTSINEMTDIFVWHLFSRSEKEHFDKITVIRAYRRIRRLLWVLGLLTKLYRVKLLRPMLGSNVRRFIEEINVSLP